MTTTIGKLTILSSVRLGMKLAAVILFSNQLVAVSPVKTEEVKKGGLDITLGTSYSQQIWTQPGELAGRALGQEVQFKYALPQDLLLRLSQHFSYTQERFDDLVQEDYSQSDAQLGATNLSVSASKKLSEQLLVTATGSGSWYHSEVDRYRNRQGSLGASATAAWTFHPMLSLGGTASWKRFIASQFSDSGPVNAKALKGASVSSTFKYDPYNLSIALAYGHYRLEKFEGGISSNFSSESLSAAWAYSEDLSFSLGIANDVAPLYFNDSVRYISGVDKR